MENIKIAIDTANILELALLLQEYYTHYGFTELLELLMKTLEKYQLNWNPKYIDTFPFRTETEVLLICKQRRSQRLLERLIICCAKGIKISKLKSSVPMKMRAFIQNFRFCRGAVQFHTSHGLSSESWPPESWYLPCGYRDVQGLPLPQSDVIFVFSSHQKVKAMNIFHIPLSSENLCCLEIHITSLSEKKLLLAITSC